MTVIERTSNAQFTAKAIEDGYEIYDGDKLYKKVHESTFKRYFKVVSEAEPQPEVHKAEPVEPETANVSENTEESVEVTAEKRQQIIDKIKKLLTLAGNNPSQEEALSATLMAQKLMAKYKIEEDETLDEIKEDDAIDSIVTNQKKNSDLHSWRKQLALIVAKNFCCKCYMKGADVVFRGYRQDAEIALNAYMYLYTIGNSLGSKAYMETLKKTGSGKGIYNSFVMGFLKGVDEGLSVQCTALMLIVPQAVEDEWKSFSANFGKGRTATITISDIDAYSKGKREGKAAVNSRAIEKKGR